MSSNSGAVQDLREVGEAADSDEDSSMEGEDNTANAAIEQARQERDSAPQNYEAHYRLVHALRSKAEDINALRDARLRFARQFPLPPSQWEEWVEDELQIASSSEERLDVLVELFPQALSDYLHVGLHEKQLALAKEMWRAKEISVDEVHDIFQKSKWMGASSHFLHGKKLWDLYKSFLVESGEPETQRKQHLETYLSSPLSGREEASDAIETVMGDCAGFEAKLADCRSEPALENGERDEQFRMQYRSYAEYAKGVSPSFAISIYERCVAECFLSPDVWLDYIQYCRTLPEYNRSYFVCNRAARNVPWVLDVWVSALLSIPDASEWMINGSREDAFCSLLERATPYVMNSNDLQGAENLTKAAWTVYLALQATEETRDVARKALDFNVSTSMQWASASCYAASILSLKGDMPGSESVLEKVVSARAEEPRWWLEYATVIARAGPTRTTQARRLFERAIAQMQSAEDIDILLDAWVKCECREASDKASVPRIVAQAFEYASSWRTKMVETVHGRNASRIGQRDERSLKSGRPQKNKQRSLPKRKRAKTISDKDNVTNERMATDDASKGNPDGTNHAEVFTGSELGDEGKHAGEKMAIDAPTKTAGSMAGGGGKPDENDYEPNTIFVNNLAFAMTEAELRQTFNFAGNIKGVRLPRRSDGASKGIAYVEFDDDSCVEKALALHNRPVNGRAVWVRRSKPPSRKARKAKAAAGGAAGKAKPRRAGAPAPQGLGMMQPRTLQRRTLINAPRGTAEADSDSEMPDAVQESSKVDDKARADVKPKNQDDFRALFLQKKSS